MSEYVYMFVGLWNEMYSIFGLTVASWMNSGRMFGRQFCMITQNQKTSLTGKMFIRHKNKNRILKKSKPIYTKIDEFVTEDDI